MDQPKQTNPDQDKEKAAKESNWKIANTTPTINPDVDLVNRTLP